MEIPKYKNHLSLGNKIGRLLWTIAYYVLFRPFGTRLFRSYRNFILRLFGAKLHKTANVHASVRIWAPWFLTMKEGACIDDRVNLYNVNMVTLEEYATISQESFICPGTHDIKSPGHEMISWPIVIGVHAWVAVRAFVGSGVKIGDYAVVGAGAAVFKDVEPWTVVGGNPAKFIKKRIIKDA